MARSLKKGPFADAESAEESRCHECSLVQKQCNQDLVPSLYNFPAASLDIHLPCMTEEDMCRYM